MRVSSEQDRQLTVRHPLSGVSVARSSGGPLVRGIPARYGTTLHLAGDSEWKCGRSSWASRAGTVSVKVPGEVYVEHARVGLSRSQSVLFDASLIDEARAALDRPILARLPHLVDARALVELHRQLLDDDDDDEDVAGIEQAVCAAVAAIVDVICEPRGTRFGASAFTVAVARTRALLEERLTETVTLDELAAHARLDKFQLCRAFREQVGLPPHAYVTHRRVSLAQELLASGKPPAEVASRVGLYDQSLLHRHFKRILGITPGAFARAAR